MTIQEFLLHITTLAYNGDEMSLLCGVFPRRWVPPDNLVPDPERNLTDAVARRETELSSWTMLKVLQHVADCKAMYMTQAFGEPPQPFPAVGDDLESVLAYLDAAHDYLITCLANLDETDLGKPLPTTAHGESAAHLFWVMAQHDVNHGSQILSLRKIVEHFRQ